MIGFTERIEIRPKDPVLSMFYSFELVEYLKL